MCRSKYRMVRANGIHMVNITKKDPLSHLCPRKREKRPAPLFSAVLAPGTGDADSCSESSAVASPFPPPPPPRTRFGSSTPKLPLLPLPPGDAACWVCAPPRMDRGPAWCAAAVAPDRSCSRAASSRSLCSARNIFECRGVRGGMVHA
jgi:hypothetical protein